MRVARMLGLCLALILGSAMAQVPTPGPTAAPSKGPTASPTTPSPTTPFPTTPSPTTPSPTTPSPTTSSPTTPSPTTPIPTTLKPTTAEPTTPAPSTLAPTTSAPTKSPTAAKPTKAPTIKPTTSVPSTRTPTSRPSAPSSLAPTTSEPSAAPTVAKASSAAFIYASYLFAVLALCVAIGAVTFILYFRDLPIMMMSQVTFMALVAGGILLISLSLLPLIYSVNNISEGVCLAHDWLFNVGFVVALASLFLKEYRSFKLYRTTNSLRSLHVETKSLLLWALGFVSVIVAILIAHTVGGYGKPDGLRCGTGLTTYLMFVYEFILAVVDVGLAIMARHVPAVAGESINILISASFVLFAVIFCAIILISNTLTVAVEALLVVFAIFFCTMVSLFFLVFKRFAYRHLSRQEVIDKFFAASATPRAGSRHASGNAPTSNSSFTNASGPPSSKELGEANGGSETSSSFANAKGLKGPATKMDNVVVSESSVDLAGATQMSAEDIYRGRLALLIEEKKKMAFFLGVNGVWEHYVDRDGGYEWWLNKENLEILSEDPENPAQNALELS